MWSRYGGAQMIDRNKKPAKIDNAYMARLCGLRYGYNDPSAVEFRRRARWDRRIVLAQEVGTVLLWIGVAYLWMTLTWTGE